MKIIRSKTPVTYGDRKKKTGLIAIRTEIKWSEQSQRYLIDVHDCEVVDRINPQPGEPLKNYPVFNTEQRVRTKEDVNQLFTYFGIDILAGQDDFTEKFSDLVVKSLLFDTQNNPVYGTTADDWEIVDTRNEVQP